ncbi:hypothetical protein [Bifidobacterium sp. ESL0732]|uniref:hypothetical protein n=1 Tax=Bifidobacterium sp. ESL0732 TaxID=2983222 RepID=UPI0023F84CC4|nr:hypothetical protein [Bifidobacterium sp. ESL0732]WEV64569.1 hypothetical protein OZX70_03055 [Bifidobacterium sp. ESL0732]
MHEGGKIIGTEKLMLRRGFIESDDVRAHDGKAAKVERIRLGAQWFYSGMATITTVREFSASKYKVECNGRI